MMSGSVVNGPCPISAAGETMLIVPSVPMVIHVLGAKFVSAAASPVSASGSSVSASVRPAVVARKSRRLIWFMASALPRRALDRADNLQVGAAAADVAVHVGDDLVARRALVGGEQFGRLHDLAGLAVAALRHLLGDPGLLQRMGAVGGKALDGGHRFAFDQRHRHGAGARRPAIDVYGAGAA